MNRSKTNRKAVVITILFASFSIHASAQINARFIKELNALIDAKPADIISKDTVSNTNGIVAYKSKLPFKGCRTYYLQGALSLNVHAYYLPKATDATVDSVLHTISSMPYTIVDSKTDAEAAKKMDNYTTRLVTIKDDKQPKFKTEITLSKGGDMGIRFTKREGW